MPPGSACSTAAGGRLLYEHGVLPRCYFPRADVRMDLLERTDEVSESPFKGRTVHWRLRIGDHVVEDAAISHPSGTCAIPITASTCYRAPAT